MAGPGGSLTVVHLDMDAFYASVEQRDNPSLRGKPVVVGGLPSSRGVVCAASYEARRFGIRSAMPVAEAYRRCPDATFLPGRMRHYQGISREIMGIIGEYSLRVEPLSLDEAYCQLEPDGATALAREMKDRIKGQLELTASVGVSYNKFLAKLGSEMDKPNGFMVIDTAEARRILPCLPVRRLWGVGPRTERTLKALGIRTAGDLVRYPKALLERKLGSRGSELRAMAQGEDHRAVEGQSTPKSLGEERTFPADVLDNDALAGQLESFAHDLKGRLQRHHLSFRTVTVKVKYADFSSASRSYTYGEPRQCPEDMTQPAMGLLNSLVSPDVGVRLIGLTLSNLHQPELGQQLALPLPDTP